MTARDRAVLVDIDGTLALRGERSPYDWHRVGEDVPNPAVVELVRTLYVAKEHFIVLLSGRDESCRPHTEAWLAFNRIPSDELFMRPHKDNRKDSIVKKELYHRWVEPKYEVAFVLDDREQVVRMWRKELGLTCLQVAEGKF